MNILGVDPGIRGGLAVVSGGNEIGILSDAIDIPTIGIGAAERVDVAAVRDWILLHRPALGVDRAGAGHAQTRRFVRIQIRRAVGALEATIVLCAVPIQIVEPSVWKRYWHLAGKDKERARQRALESFSGAHALLARKTDHGRAEAALIALYGLRNFRGNAAPPGAQPGSISQILSEANIMTNELTPEPKAIDDDGFAGSLNSGRTLKGSFLKWNDAAHWQDRDGLAPPSPLLVIAVKELLQKWKGGQAETITEHPLPNVEELNSAIPEQEWEIGKDGQPQKPWKHTVAVYLVSPATGSLFTYMASTIGAHIAYDALKEAVITMRALRGTRVMPLVLLAERPMKTKFGTKLRPHFEIISWKTPGEDSQAIPSKPTPQLSGPAPAPTVAEAKTTTPQAKPKSKPTVNLTAETLAHMSDVKQPTSAEIFNDEIGF